MESALVQLYLICPKTGRVMEDLPDSEDPVTEAQCRHELHTLISGDCVLRQDSVESRLG